ncbi:hypothetical protein GCM10020254_84590 [Streptomyces goshikiensis]
MNATSTPNGMPRRQFVALSGALGAGALLAGAGGSASAAACPPPGSGSTSGCPSPTDPPPPGGPSPCPPGADAASLRQSRGHRPAVAGRAVLHAGDRPAQRAQGGLPQDHPPNYVVLHGVPVSTHNYLTVPACRITGIECPFLLTPNVANYWHEAWENARRGGDVPVQYRYIGLGINSQAARQLDQLHIHMAGVRDSTQLRLQALDAAGRVATNPSQWGIPSTRRW